MKTQVLWGGAKRPSAAKVENDDPARRLIGRLLDDRFEIVDVIGRGGMGVVYGATDHVLERPVVVKVMSPGGAIDRVGGERLVREARLACRIEHPAIVTVFHLGVLETGEPYVVMEKLVGRDLGALLSDRKGPLTPTEVVAVLEPIADALEALHTAGIVHRDLKPDNMLLLGARWERPRMKLIDFGLAMLDETSTTRLTRAGKLLGTAEYIAPEVALGSKATPASDVYALASTAFELLSGMTPFAGEPMDVLVAKTSEDAPRLSVACSDRRLARFDAVLARALDRDPSRRPNVVQLVRELAAAMVVEPTERIRRVEVAPSEPPAPAPALAQPSPLIAWAALGTGVLALLTALLSLAR